MDLICLGGMTHRASDLNEDIRNNISEGSRVIVMLRVGDDPLNANDTEALQIIVATNSRIETNKAKKITTVLGAEGGYYEEVGNDIQSAFGTWDIDLADLNPTNWFTRVTANPPSNNNGIYIVYTNYKRFDDIAGDYVFKDYVPGRPELNRIYGDLLMSNQPILGVDNIDMTGDLTLASSAYINGTANLQQNANFNQSNVTANEQLSANNVTISGINPANPGELIVEGDVQANNNLNLNNDISADRAVINNELNVNNHMMAQTRSVFEGNVTVNGRLNANRMLTISELNVNSSGTRSEIGPLTVNSAATVNNRDLSTRSLVVGGNVRSDGLYASDINFETLRLQGSFGSCESGC